MPNMDGVGASWVMGQFYQSDANTNADQAPEWNPSPYPSWFKRLWWAVRDWPSVMITNVPSLFRGVWNSIKLQREHKKSGKPPHPSISMMQKTPINRTVSPGRTFVCESIPLEKLRAVGKRFDATINDVFLSCSAGAVRRLFQDKNYDPNAHPLIAGAPFAGERPLGMEGLGNFATLDFCWLHTEIEDPVLRLKASHQAAAEMKEHLKAVKEAGADINTVLQVLPPWMIRLIRWWIHRNSGRISFFGNIVLSNVPGPKEHLYLGKYKLENWFSTGQIFDGSGLNITMWSYCGNAI